MPATEWLTPQDLAAELKVPVQTLYMWRTKSVGPRGHRIGRHLRYRRRDIEAWLDQQASQPAPDAA
ncbi:MAG TPA: helix-turn-helix domain-containing protein [Streptosporangiaceae bacterium]|jgi:excisionase family DNA binding protein|nr:helix-turn-helix domain-containing protein [Streptosporangiaceae bacterium]